MNGKLVFSVVAAGAVVLALIHALGRREPKVSPSGIQATVALQDATSELLEGEEDPEQRTAAEAADSGATFASAPHASRNGALRVTVVDLDGAPVQGATVRTFQDSVPGERLTDALGVCFLPIEPGPGSLRLEVAAEGFFPRVESVKRQADIRLRIGPVATLFGRVVDSETGNPLSGAVLECDSCEPERKTTDEDGTYDGLRAPVGFPVLIRAAAADYPRSTLRFELREHGRIRRDVELNRGHEFTGRIVDHASGLPLPDVGITPPTGYTGVRTGPDGRFALRLLPDENGRASVRLTLASYCVSICFLRVPQPGQDLVEIPMVRSCPVEGVVRDPLGAPIAGASVEIFIDHARHRAGIFGDTRLEEELGILADETDEAGGFQMESGVQPWGSYEVIASHPDHKKTEADLSAAEPGETVHVDIVMQPAAGLGSIRGRLTVNGEPRSAVIYWQGPTRTGVVKSSPDGSYRLESVELGEVLIGARLEEFGELAELEGSTAVLHLSVGAELHHNLEVRVPVATISGRVRNPQGMPLANEVVFAHSNDLQARVTARTGGDGAYVLTVLDGPARYDLCLRKEWRHGIPPGARGVDFTLPSCCKLLVRALDRSSGNAVERFQLFSRRPGEASYEHLHIGLPDEDGWHELDLLPGPVDFVIPATAQGCARLLRNDVIVADGTRVEFELEQGLVATFQLAEGLAPWSEKVSVLLLEDRAFDSVLRWEENGSWNLEGGELYPGLSALARSVRFDSDGLARVRGLDRGLHRFKVLSDKIAIDPEFVDVGAQAEPIVLRWSAH